MNDHLQFRRQQLVYRTDATAWTGNGPSATCETFEEASEQLRKWIDSGFQQVSITSEWKTVEELVGQ